MADCISKLMNLGMPLGDAIQRATVNPAKATENIRTGTLAWAAPLTSPLWQMQEGAFGSSTHRRSNSPGRRSDLCFDDPRWEVVFDQPARGARVPLYDIVLRNGHVVDPASGRDDGRHRD